MMMKKINSPKLVGSCTRLQCSLKAHILWNEPQTYRTNLGYVFFSGRDVYDLRGRT